MTSNGELEVNVGLPGLTVECSVDGGEMWIVCPSKLLVQPHTNIMLRTK